MEKPEETTIEIPKVTEVTPPKIRQIVISTDGNNINLVSAEVSGKIELIAILEGLTNFLKNNNK